MMGHGPGEGSEYAAVTQDIGDTQVAVNYVLIDMENVQPEGLDNLVGLPVKVVVFVGENQTRVPLDFAAAMQQLGNAANYVKMSGNGPNALDFHIACYLGKLATSDPSGIFHIISKDTGFDPLIKHLRTDHVPKIRVYRKESIGKLSFLQPATTGLTTDRVALVVENFRKRGTSLPKTLQGLHSTISTLFRKELPANEVGHIIEKLERMNFLKRNNGVVTYITNGKA